MAIGTARIRVAIDVTAVPQIRSAAPNWFVTAFHSLVVRKLRPNAEMASDDRSTTL